MELSERVKQTHRDAEGGSARARVLLGLWYLQGLEGLEKDGVQGAAWLLKVADLGHARAEVALAECHMTGEGVQQSFALGADWMRKAADKGDAVAQFIVGRWLALGPGVKKDLPLGKKYLELGAAQGLEQGVTLLMELRKCVACGKLDVHHIICSRCRNRRYCDKGCQLRHWNSPLDPHKLNCATRRESVGAEGHSAVASAGNAACPIKQALEVAATAAAAAAAAKVEAAKAAEDAASAASEAAETSVTAARAAMMATPAASKKDKKKKAKLGAKVKAAETAAAAAAEAAGEARAALDTARAALQASL